MALRRIPPHTDHDMGEVFGIVGVHDPHNSQVIENVHHVGVRRDLSRREGL